MKVKGHYRLLCMCYLVMHYIYSIKSIIQNPEYYEDDIASDAGIDFSFDADYGGDVDAYLIHYI